MNVLTIAGNIGQQPRLNSINGQQGPISVLNFSVAVKKRQKDPVTGEYGTLWVECSLWGARADSLAKFLSSGSKVSVSGEADISSYQNAQGVMIPKLTLRVSDITLMGGGEQQPQAGGYQQQGVVHQQRQMQQQQQANGGYQMPQQRPAQQQPSADYDDSIPF